MKNKKILKKNDKIFEVTKKLVLVHETRKMLLDFRQLENKRNFWERHEAHVLKYANFDC